MVSLTALIADECKAGCHVQVMNGCRAMLFAAGAAAFFADGPSLLVAVIAFHALLIASRGCI